MFCIETQTHTDGMLREHSEHARGRNLADCGSPRKSVGSFEEMWRKCTKWLTMWIVTVEMLRWFCEKNADSIHKLESTLWYFAQFDRNNCGNYNVDLPLCGKMGLKFFIKLEVN